MTLLDVKLKINEETGIPLDLLTAESAAETLAQAQTLLAMRRQQKAGRPQSACEQFAEWMNGGVTAAAEAEAAADAAALARVVQSFLPDVPPAYPTVHDGGGVSGFYTPSAQEQFADVIYGALAFDPRKDSEGWVTLGTL